MDKGSNAFWSWTSRRLLTKYQTETYPAIDPSRPELSLRGKSAIVSGGGGSIGSAIVSALAQAGVALVGIVGRTQKTLDETRSKVESQYPHAKIVAVTADLCSPSSLESAFGKIRAQSEEPIDIFVHNAGFLAEPGSIAESDPKEWWASFEVNVLGAFNSVRAFTPVASHNATIVNVSTAGVHFPVDAMAGISAYCASKASALKVFEYVQSEHPNFQVVSMHPGVVESDMNNKHAAMTPMDKADLAASFTVWLCSPEAKFLRNKFVWANWDVDEMKAKAAEIQGSPAFSMNLTGWPVLS
jgi:NAD(P)-dependent dehydrogenase (short-subunit alcohol dehydrogenase family)